MKMKKCFIFFILIFLSLPIFSAHVSFEDACIVAKNWANILRTDFNHRVTILSGESIKREDIDVAYVFHFSPRGYVIVSAEDYLPPIKLYSLNNNFGKEGKPFEETILNQYLEIINAVNSSRVNPRECFSEKNRENFKLLRSDYYMGVSSRKEDAAPLLSTTWNQAAPYNLKCPEVDGKRTYTGCVATAFAQVMKYHAFPDRGQRSWAYVTRTHEISLAASFDHPYHWDLMLDDYPEADSGTEEQREAVAQLIFDVGVALETDYTLEGSGVYYIQPMIAFPKLFKYSRDLLLIGRLGWNNADWFNLVKAQVDQKLPVPFGIYREGSGHMVVIDGYRISAGATTFHLNMGWGGAWDGYYSLNNIVAADRFYTLLEPQCYFLNMVPPGSGIDLPSQDCGGTAYENRSLFLKEYYCELTWQAHPAGADIIDRYEIYGYDNLRGFYIKMGEIAHTGQTGLIRYSFRLPDYTSHFYIILSIDKNEEQALHQMCYLILQEDN